MSDLEPASALAAIDVTPVDHPKTPGEVFAFQLLTESWIDETGQHDQKRMGQLIESDRAAVREPLERRIAGLTTRLEFNRDALTEQTWRIASLEAQLASAREEALREVLRDLQQFADSFLAEARKAEISGRYDQFSEHARSRALVQTCAQRVRKLLPPPAAQKEPL